MTLWIIAAAAGAVLVAGLVVLRRRREDDAVRRTSLRHAWDARPTESDGARLAPLPPPAGLPIATQSEELDRASALASTELWLEDDEETGPVPKIVVNAAAKSDPGKKRKHNEDAFLVWPEQEIYAIADGMGGYAAGEVAAQLAVTALREAFSSGDLGPLEEGLPKRGAELVAAVHIANERIRAEAKRDERKAGMGTTIVAARFSPGRRRVYIAHVGDSRCYRMRDGVLQQLTIDHTLAAMGIEGPTAGKLSRAVGVFDHVEVDLTVDEPRPGDRYLLCSDGLYKMLGDEVVREMLQDAESIEEAVEALVDAANERGGRDNVTVVLVRVDEPDVRPRESGEHRIAG